MDQIDVNIEEHSIITEVKKNQVMISGKTAPEHEMISSDVDRLESMKSSEVPDIGNKQLILGEKKIHTCGYCSTTFKYKSLF